MTPSNSELTIRACAFEIIRLCEEHARDNAALARALKAPLQRIVSLPDLLSLGVKRQGNHIENSKYLYYDGQLVISLDDRFAEFEKEGSQALPDFSAQVGAGDHPGRPVVRRQPGMVQVVHVQAVADDLPAALHTSLDQRGVAHGHRRVDRRCGHDAVAV